MEKRFYLHASLIFSGLFLFAVPLWVNKYFGAAAFDQVLFTLKFGLKSTLSSDPIFIKRFIKWCLIGPALAGTLLLMLGASMRRIHRSMLYGLLFFSGVFFFLQQFSVVSFLMAQFKQPDTVDFYSSQYVDPRYLTFSATAPKNLVLIYVESLEAGYTDTTVFKRNLLQALQRHQDDSASFDTFQQLPGTGWTIAGLVATQCGIPLKSVTVFGNNRQGEVMDTFLENAVCLSDILATLGYQNIYMKGASLRFGGIKQFLRSHHYTEVYGKEEWRSYGKPDTELGWGFHDDALFAAAKTRLTQLIADGQRFNLTLLTVDTHGDEGFLNPSCQKKGYRNFDGIVACTGDELADFVDYIKANHWLDRISLVIIGDHLAMKNPLSAQLESQSSRSIFNTMIMQPKPVLRTTIVNHFDWLPTLLDALGIDYAGDHVALGYSGLQHAETVTAPPVGRFHQLEANALRYSDIYNQLWA